MMHHISLIMLWNAVQTLVGGSLYLQSRIKDLIVGFRYDISLMILLFAKLTQQLIIFIIYLVWFDGGFWI